jgi:uncharacterized membrane protein YfcA
MNSLAKMKKQMDPQIIWIALAIGLGAGIMSGLIGIGGGIIMVPALVFFLQYNQHQAQGTSLAVLTFPVVILASFYYYNQCKAQGNPIDLRIVGLLAAGFLVGAYLGGRLALNLSQAQLKQIFAVVLIYTAIKMLAWDQWALQLFKKS